MFEIYFLRIVSKRKDVIVSLFQLNLGSQNSAGLRHHFDHDFVEHRWKRPTTKYSIKLLYTR